MLENFKGHGFKTYLSLLGGAIIVGIANIFNKHLIFCNIFCLVAYLFSKSNTALFALLFSLSISFILGFKMGITNLWRKIKPFRIISYKKR